MFCTKSTELMELNHEILRERFQNVPDSIDKCTDQCKVVYVEGLHKIVDLSTLALASVGPTVYENIVRFSREAAGWPAVAEPVQNAQQEPWWRVARKALLLMGLKWTFEYFGRDLILPVYQRAIASLSQAFDSNKKATKQMSMMVIINETDYTFNLSDAYDMIGPSPASTFTDLAAREIGSATGELDYYHWGAYSTGSGSTSGSASAVKLKTTSCPAGGQDFYFIVSASCPAWTPTNTMALKLGPGSGLGHADVKHECEDNESAKSDEATYRERNSPDGHVLVTATLSTVDSKRAFVVVRITSTDIVAARARL